MKTRQSSMTGKYFLVSLTGIVLFFSFTAVVFSHAELLSAQPQPGSTVNNPVGLIELVFAEPVSDASEITLFGENFRPITDIETQYNPSDPATLRAMVPDLEPGSYTVQYTAVSVDGHTISGSYTFRVSASGLAVSSPQLLIFGLGILLMAVIVVMWRRSRSTD